MRKLILIASAFAPLLSYAQYELNNKGATIYTEKGAIITVGGSFINDAGVVKNDGTIELQGDFENKPGSTFTVNSDNTSKDRTVKFMGSGTQAIKGAINTAGTASFYNLVVDKSSSTEKVEMQGDVAVEGSVVFGTDTRSNTYNPSNVHSNNNQKGLIKTYTESGEYSLNVLNSSTDAIAGTPAMAMNGAPTTGYILTSGNRGSNSGGLLRNVASTTGYDFPIGTANHGFNAVRMNFTNIPAGGGLVKGKFNDGTENPNGYVGSIAQQCIGCTPQFPTPDNNGYNHFFASNPCNNNAGQWVIFEEGIANHGYWSFASAGNDQSYQYSIETFPNNYSMQGNNNDTWRTLKYAERYGYNPSGEANNWNQFIDSVSTPNDLLEYTKNAGTCYAGNGIPGGIYTGFGHYSMMKSKSNNALPVKLLYVNATPQSQDINVSFATALEINNAGFEIERSTDGLNFSKIGWVTGHNNSTVQNDYAYMDNNVQPNTVYYYKLNQVDNDGRSEASNIVSAEIGGTMAFTISDPMPNPASDIASVTVHSSVSNTMNIQVYNMVGQLVSEQDAISLNAGNNNVVLNLQSLASGNYSAVLTCGESRVSKLIVVSK